MGNKRPIRLSVISSVFLSCTSVFAQQPQDGVLDPVVVTASRLKQPLTDTIAHTTVITRKEIRESQAVDLPTLLQREAGVEFVQNGGIGTSSSIFLRGADSQQVLVLIDGVRVGSATLGTTAIENLTLDQIERVEIVRGNVSALYGANAIGGVIQIFTKHGHGLPHGEAQVMVGSHNTERVSASYGGSVNETSFHIGVSQFDTAGFSAIDPRLAPKANPDNDGYRNQSFSGQLTHRIAVGQEIGLRAFQSNGTVNFDNAYGKPTDINYLDSSTATYSVYSTNQFSSFWTSHITLADGIDKSHSHTNSLPATRFDTNDGQLLWQNDFKIAPDHVVTAGAERRRERIDSTTNYTYTARDVKSYMLAYSGRIGPHQLQASTRQDDYSDFGNADTWLVGYGYDVTAHWKVTAMRSSAFRAPTFNELFYPGFGNPQLQPEKTYSSEAGLQYAVENHVLRATAFRTQYQNLIQTVLAVPPFTYQAENVGRARVEGTELSYSGRFSGWNVRASMTVQQPRDSITGAQLRRQATRFGNLAVTNLFYGWRLGGELRVASSRPDNDIVTGAPVKLGGYGVINFTARRRLTRNVQLGAKLENAFNKYYQLAHGYNVPGRALFVTLSWRQQ